MEHASTTANMALPWEPIQAFRAGVFRLLPGRQLRTPDEAVDFVNERGFVYFWPITGITMPSLWVATAGERPVADAHDDPGHVTWGWKDGLLGSRRWYYAKVLRKKATMIALDALPYFYALSENYGAYEEDYLTLYEQGRLTAEAKLVYETLLDKGPLDTVELRRATRMTSAASDSRFNRALTDLQADFKILPVGVADAGAWHYAFTYEITARWYPDLPEQAHAIRERAARCKLARLYFEAVGAAQLRDLTRLFGWRPAEAQKILDTLAQEGILARNLAFTGYPGEWAALRSLVAGPTGA